jgi:serine protease AprX
MYSLWSRWQCDCSQVWRMDTSLARFKQIVMALGLTALAAPGAVYAQGTPDAKLDESLRESVERGCVGTQPVIIRTKPGYRQAVRDALTAHGDLIKGEFPSLEAIAAVVHCEDLSMLATFDSVSSVSLNGPVAVQGLALPILTTSAQSAVAAARASLVAAKAGALEAQKAVRAAEKAAALANSLVTAAKKALIIANRLTGAAKITAVASAQAKLASAEATARAAQNTLETARRNATGAQAAALNAQNALVNAQEALQAAVAAVAARVREGRAARGLKKKFFATMPVRASQIHTDAEFDNETVDYASLEAYAQTGGGTGVGVAVVDSGIEPGTDFGNRIAAFYDFTYGDIRAVTAMDPYGHGTHVAGLIASDFVGIAPNARLIGLRVLDEKGQGDTANVVRAIEFAIANKSLLGIDVLNLSLGHPIYEPAASDPLVQAVEHATRAGIVVVVSAGNFGLNRKTGLPGYAGIASPGNAPSALTTGATRTFNTVTRADDRVAPFSSRGPSWYDGFAKPDFVAPGDNLLSIGAGGSKLRVAQELRGNAGNYMRLSGTSMAAGVASGVVALVLQANRGLTPNAVKAVLQYTSIPVLDDDGGRFDPLAQGAGQIEVSGSVALARAINPQAPVGTPWLSTTLTPSTTIGNVSYAWSRSIIWGARRIAGETLMSEQRPAWGLNIIWGEGLGDEDDNIVWGNNFGDDDNIVWGNSFDDDDNIVWGNNIIWGDSFDDDNIVWGNLFDDDDNIVWGNLFDDDDNIVWGNNIVWGDSLIGFSLDDDNIVWGNNDDDNIVWGNLDDDNVVWGNLYDDNVVWGNSDDDNIVWGNDLGDDDNIVWGNTSQLGSVFKWSGGFVSGRASNARARRMVRKDGVN